MFLGLPRTAICILTYAAVNFNKAHKQLAMSLVGVLIVIIVAMIFERGGVLSKNKNTTETSVGIGIVKGESDENNLELALYRKKAKEWLTVLEANADALEKNEPSSPEGLAAAQNDLITITVPIVYQEMHLKLAVIADRLQAKQSLDINFTAEQIRLLKAKYPWLAISIEEKQ